MCSASPARMELRRPSRSLRPTRRAVPEESCLRRHHELQLLSADPTRMRVDFDCVDLAPRCEDIDGDLKKECAGTFDLNDFDSPACTNVQCTDSLAPVCEAASFGSTTHCGQYGLCVGDGDCAEGFSCLGLWPDGRMECVLDGGSCSSFADCAPQQVCACPQRIGGCLAFSCSRSQSVVVRNRMVPAREAVRRALAGQAALRVQGEPGVLEAACLVAGALADRRAPEEPQAPEGQQARRAPEASADRLASVGPAALGSA